MPIIWLNLLGENKVKHFANRLLLFVSLIYSSLLIAQTSDQAAIARLLELSDIPTQASIDEILALAGEASTNEMRQQFVFTALIQIGPSTSGDNFAKSVLDDVAAGPALQRAALGYLAEHPSSWMEPYALSYMDVAQHAAIRCMAAYLAGRLGLAAQKSTLIAIINNDDNGDWRMDAAIGLAHLSDVTEFPPLLAATSLRDWDKNLVQQYHDFIWVDDTDKDTMVGTLYQRSETFLVLAAFRYMLENNRGDLLKQYRIVGEDQDQNVVIQRKSFEAMVRILGYSVSGDIDAVQITKLPLL